MATATDLTRQQLDELDALLQRMLNPQTAAPEPTTLAPPPGWRVDASAPVAAPHLNLAALEPELVRPDPIEIVMPSPMVEFAPREPVAAEPVLEPVFAPLTPVAVESRPTLPIALWPLIAVNWILESLLKLFGPPGETLTRRNGKNALAIAGVLMMFGAALWTAQGQGWVRLPLDGIKLSKFSGSH